MKYPSEQQQKDSAVTAVVALIACIILVFWTCSDGDEEKKKIQAPLLTQEQMDEQHFRQNVFPKFQHQVLSTMHNPSSYENVDTWYEKTDDYYVIRHKFRGTNSFGGVVTQEVNALLDSAGNIVKILE